MTLLEVVQLVTTEERFKDECITLEGFMRTTNIREKDKETCDLGERIAFCVQPFLRKCGMRGFNIVGCQEKTVRNLQKRFTD